MRYSFSRLSFLQVLLSELVGYKSYKQKGVCAAARSLLQVCVTLGRCMTYPGHVAHCMPQHYRDVAPHLLHKKQRGRIAAMAGDGG
jgi:hypothetical protein